jgi:hypothetical protein
MSQLFAIGDRVRRDIDVFHPERGYRSGIIVNRYGKRGGLGGVTWYDHELYAVKFDDGRYEEGFFRHGLTPEEPS